MQVYQEKIGAINVNLLETDKYKSNRIVFKFRAQLERETLTKRSLLAILFETSNKKYPTQTAFRKKLAYLYGADFYTSVEKKGNEHILTVILDLVDGKLVAEGDKLLEAAFAFLTTVFFEPLVFDYAFDDATLEVEKANLRSRLESIFDDKIRYANKRLVEEMSAGDVFAYSALGVLADIDSITAESLYTYYQQFLADDIIDVFICGDISRDKIIPLIEKLPFKKRNERKANLLAFEARSQSQEINEIQPINQGKLVIGYGTNTLFGDDDFVAMQLANGLLGRYPNSKIFINVREKESLAYYASSGIDSFKGVMLITAGIDEKNYQQALAIIGEQVTAMKEADFTEEELEQTKQMYINELLETGDNVQGLIELHYNNVLRGKDLTLENWIEQIKQTTKQEVVTAINKIKLDTIYFLSKGEAIHEEN